MDEEKKAALAAKLEKETADQKALEAFEADVAQLKPLSSADLKAPTPVEHLPSLEQALQATEHESHPDHQHHETVPHHHEPAGHDRPGHHVSRPKLNSRITEIAGDATVRLIDDGNFGGLGIKIDFKDPADKPSPAVIKTLREEHDGKRGLSWNSVLGQSRKPVRFPIYDRVDAERRHAEVVRIMKEEKGESQGRE